MLDRTFETLLIESHLFQSSYYRSNAGLPASMTDGEVLAHYLNVGVHNGEPPSPLFDAAVVLAAARALQLAEPEPGEPALAYWLREGMSAGIVPTRLVDAAFYERCYPDVAAGPYWSFQHFVQFGLAENRRPNAWFDPEWYRSQMLLPADCASLLMHFLLDGASSGVSPSAWLQLMSWPVGDSRAMLQACLAVDVSLRALADLLDIAQIERLASLFLPAYYRAQASLPPVTSDAQAFRHFVQSGLAAGLSCSPLFDPAYYLRMAKEAGLPPLGPGEVALVHWLRYGLAAQIVPSPCFDMAFYLDDNPDVAADKVFGYVHFIDFGQFEGRRANRWFDMNHASVDGTSCGMPGLQAYLVRAAERREAPCQLIADATSRRPDWLADMSVFGAAYPVLLARFQPMRDSLPPWALDLMFALFDPASYAVTAGLAEATPPLRAFVHFLDIGLDAGLAPGLLFDADCYRKRVASRADCTPVGAEPPLLHFLREGTLKRISPTHRFDEAFYFAANPDLDPHRMFGFEHFANHGVGEGRLPHGWFDTGFCAAKLSGDPSVPVYLRLLGAGLDEGVVPSPKLAALLGRAMAPGEISRPRFDALLAASEAVVASIGHGGLEIATALFVPEAYDGNGALAQDAGMLDRLIHFLQTGLSRGHAVGPLFDAAFYTTQARRAGLSFIGEKAALLHFIEHGLAARIVPTPLFDNDVYLSANPDLAGMAMWGFEHFIRHGVYEGRPFSPQPMASVAPPSGLAAQPSARLRLMLAAGLVPAGMSASDAGRMHWFASSQSRLREVMQSGKLAGIMADAIALEPAVGESSDVTAFLLPPFFNPMAEPHRAIKARLPRLRYDNIVTVPWIRNGGADLVAGHFLSALLRTRPGESVLLLRVDYPHFDRPDWIPDGVDVVDISDILGETTESIAEYLLQVVLSGLAPARVVNINSRLTWRCLRRFGARLGGLMRLYAYLFCWDQTQSGRRVGYPSDFYPSTAPHLAGVFTDTPYLKNELVRMYQLPPTLAARLMPLHSPALLEPCAPTMAALGAASASSRARPLVLWGGRLDHQKRFDIVIGVARSMPLVDFHCWGSAMLGGGPDLSDLPSNMVMYPGFKAFTDLPLGTCDGWLFTSAWEGMPTTVIELGTLGMPMVCSDVGGVSDLIDDSTGWLVPADASIAAYTAAVEEMVRNPAQRIERGLAVQARAVSMFAPQRYDRMLAAYLARSDEGQTA